MKLIGKEHYIFWVLSQRMMPPIAVAIPFFFIFRDLGLRDTHAGLIIAHGLVNLPLAILLMKSFMDDVPKEVDEAAMIDGATRFQSRSEEHTSELQSLMRNSYAVFCLKKKHYDNTKN